MVSFPITRVPPSTTVARAQKMVTITIRYSYIFAVFNNIVAIGIMNIERNVVGVVRLVAAPILPTFRAPVHRARAVKNQRRRCGPGLRLGSLLQDNLQRDFVLVRVRSRFRGLGDSLHAGDCRLLKFAFCPLIVIIIVAVYDIGWCSVRARLPCRQRYRREQADGQDQRQQQGYDSFHHFFFSPSFLFHFCYSCICTARAGRGPGFRGRCLPL